MGGVMTINNGPIYDDSYYKSEVFSTAANNQPQVEIHEVR
jgi:hypothetical protein